MAFKSVCYWLLNLYLSSRAFQPQHCSCLGPDKSLLWWTVLCFVGRSATSLVSRQWCQWHSTSYSYRNLSRPCQMSPGDKITSLSHLSPLRTTVSSLNFSPKLQICIFSCLLDTSVWMSNYPYLTWSRPGFWYIFLNTILPQTLHLSSLRIHPSSCLGQKPWCFLDSPLSLTPTSWFIRKS